jgi:DNA-binding response OmpR family regulator
MITTRFVTGDIVLARLTARYLVERGMRVVLADEDPDDTSFDCLVLDVRAPSGSSLAAWRAIHGLGAYAIVTLGEGGNETACIQALEAGADDYLAAPFSPRELFARIIANVRRARGEAGPRLQVLRVGDLVIDPGRLTVTLRGEVISCTSREFALLHVLAQRPGRIVTRDELIDLATGTNEAVYPRSIDVMISKLRTKLHDDSRTPQLLKTVRGTGYLLESRIP